jgi:hypothetical protein
VPDDLIQRSRDAVTRAKTAVAIAEEFDRVNKARAIPDIRELQENSERLFQHIQDSLARARTLLASRHRQSACSKKPARGQGEATQDVDSRDRLV